MCVGGGRGGGKLEQTGSESFKHVGALSILLDHMDCWSTSLSGRGAISVFLLIIYPGDTRGYISLSWRHAGLYIYQYISLSPGNTRDYIVHLTWRHTGLYYSIYPEDMRGYMYIQTDLDTRGAICIYWRHTGIYVYIYI